MTRKSFIWILFGVYLVPLALLGMLSFSSAWQYPRLIPETSLRAWRALGDPNGLISGLLTSLAIAVPVALLSATLAFIASYLLHRNKRRKAILWMALIPFCSAPVITAANLQFYFVWGSLSASYAGVIIAQLLVGIPYAFIVFSTFWTPQRSEVENAARTLGASAFQALLKVHLPAAKPIVYIALLQLFLFSWFEFGLTQLIGVGKIKTLTTQVMQYTQEGDLAFAAVAALLLVLPPMAVLIAIRKIPIYGA